MQIQNVYIIIWKECNYSLNKSKQDWLCWCVWIKNKCIQISEHISWPFDGLLIVIILPTTNQMPMYYQLLFDATTNPTTNKQKDHNLVVTSSRDMSSVNWIDVQISEVKYGQTPSPWMAKARLFKDERAANTKKLAKMFQLAGIA